MPEKKLAVFVSKRVLICYILVSIIDMVFVEQRWPALFGLTVGSVISILKFGSYSWAFGKIARINSTGTGKGAGAGLGILIFTLNQFLLLPLLYLAYKYDIWFFTGFVAGILSVPFVIMINCLTEAARITHNNFE